MAQKIFDQVAVTAPRHSSFDLSHDLKTSLKMGTLVPVLCQETLPGDSFNIAAQGMYRLAPMIAPMMEKVDITMHYFYVPNRILWERWQEFIFGGETTTSAGGFIVPPTIDTAYTVTAGSLLNYMGLPVTTVDMDLSVNALPFAAYHRIWHEFYRDENLQPTDDPAYALIDLVDGTQPGYNATLITTLRNRAWEHDYFTSCLPYAQKGDAVELPIEFTDTDVEWRVTHAATHWRNVDTGAHHGSGHLFGLDSGMVSDPGRSTDAADSTPLSFDPNHSLFIPGDSLVVTATINDLRTAFALQSFLEKNMRAGSRYTESLRAHFNVTSSDARLQRPQYIGGAKSTVAISEVLQTGSTDATSPQGNMAGHGISIMGSGGQHYRAEEHGFILCLLSIMPKTAYYQGVPKFFTRTDKFEYAFPDLASLGEQEVLGQEIYFVPNNDSVNKTVFGYIPRYAEYRYSPSRVTGQMATTLDFWHMARKFASQPHLNAAFVVSDPSKRIFAVEDNAVDDIFCQIYFSIYARRPLPLFGTPAQII